MDKRKINHTKVRAENFGKDISEKASAGLDSVQIQSTDTPVTYS